MLNINDLETRHQKYKLKSYFPYLTIFISLTIISIYAIFLFNDNTVAKVNTNTTVSKKEETLIIQNNKQNIDTNKTKKQKTTTQTVETKKELVIPKEPIEKQGGKMMLAKKEEKLRLSPSLNFIHKIQSNTLPYYEDDTNVQKKPLNKPIAKKQIIINKEKEKRVIQKPKVKIEKKQSINIKRKNDNDDIIHVIKRFNVNNNPALSLFVAKKYYQIGEYDKAYNYALITNEINNNIEASWIIFAKALVKLNKKSMAVKTLKKYINHSHSGQAKLLLDEILSGKFK